ncbi:hypothetical protein ZIOFF_033648 [Zingiber officinale]|uniref:Uncharacterized protein n=1 Tax=Zingiber officinale TaxID=94328 RepID=A0A8J5GJX5_ZINOF|nr:hypothetical protein ZIOFF_033648 [Zingiber officinale]
MDDGFCEGAGGEKIGSHMSDGFGEGARGEKIGSHMSDKEFNMLSCLSNGNATEPCFLEQCMWNYYYNEEDYLPDATFPCKPKFQLTTIIEPKLRIEGFRYGMDVIISLWKGSIIMDVRIQ